MDGVYVFCCIETAEEKDFGTISFEGEERRIFTVPWEDAAIVAMEAPVKIYHPKKDNIMTHQQVISRVMETEDAVVPVSFGNVFQTMEDTKVLLKNLYPQLSRLFPEVRNKIEIGLKVVGKKEWLESQIQQNEKVMRQKEAVAAKSEAAGYFDRIQLGEMAQKFFKQMKEDVEHDIHKELAVLAESSKSNETIGEKMLLNGAYLIDRGKEEAFDKRVNELYERWEDKVEFKYTGPWPAYNFINIKLKVEETS